MGTNSDKEMKLIASVLCPLLVRSQTIDYGTVTSEPTTETTSYIGSTWNPYKCGNCIGGGDYCCCRPEHRSLCKHGVYLPQEWDCKHGDYQLWRAVKFEVQEGFRSERKAAESEADCAILCTESDFCEAFAFNDYECTLLEALYVSNENNGPFTVGMLCEHAAEQSPDRNPDDYSWSSCNNYYDQVTSDLMPGQFVPTCNKDGSYKAEQCHGSTGYCHCVDQNGVKIQGSEVFGNADCKLSKPEKKLERLVEGTTQILDIHMKRSLPVVKRLYRTKAKMSGFLQDSLSNCPSTQDDVDEEPTRSDIPSLCEDFPRYINRLKKFASIYNGSCDSDEAPRRVNRVQKQLNQLSNRVLRNKC